MSLKSEDGVLIYVREELKSREITYAEVGICEVISIELEIKGSKILVATAYVLPLTTSWTKEEHEIFIRNTLEKKYN